MVSKRLAKQAPCVGHTAKYVNKSRCKGKGGAQQDSSWKEGHTAGVSSFEIASRLVLKMERAKSENLNLDEGLSFPFKSFKRNGFVCVVWRCECSFYT